MNDTSSLECWLCDLRDYFIKIDQTLVSLFDTYASEALFGRKFIASDLAKLQPGAKILEVGAGSLILSCQLVREGFHVTAVEPIGKGFSHFSQMRQIVLERARCENNCPLCLDLSAEAFKEYSCFDYAFSINVMEHVSDVATAIRNITNSLKIGACYHFTSPNYLFPYEPHFNVPTLFSKKITAKFFKRKIFGNKSMSNPIETWNSLNWVNTIQLRIIVRQIPKIEISFNSQAIIATIERITFEPIFASRRSPTIIKALSFFMKFRIHKLLCFIPVDLQPIIDCRLKKTDSRGY